MKNHFGKGLMAGFTAAGPCPVKVPARFCAEYKRGYVLGYCYQLAQKTGEKRVAALEAGRLTKQYNLDRNLMAEFFTEFQSDNAVRYFNIGYTGK